ncbi:MAG: hypothetical protein IAI49_15060, partial [Candidatus Eremiobacteraeota bacterium]|nr:hypothetical protein [Candidatus Eremiobacteraeota bacterium]
MRSSRVSQFVSGSATLVLLAGCAGGGSDVAGGGATQQSVTGGMPIVRYGSPSVLPPSIARRPRISRAVKPFINSDALATTAYTIAISDAGNNVID